MFSSAIFMFLGVIAPIIIRKWKGKYENEDYKLADLTKILSIPLFILPIYYIAEKITKPHYGHLFYPYLVLDFLVAMTLGIVALKMSPLNKKESIKIFLKTPGIETRLTRIIAVIIYIILSTIVLWKTIDSNPQKLLQQDFINFIAINENILLLVIVLPIQIITVASEEIVFRYFAINALKKIFTKNITIILSSVIFTLLHRGFSPDIFISGIVLGYLYYKTGSLFLCFLIHMMHNLTIIPSSYYIFYKEVGAISYSSLKYVAVLLAVQLLYIFFAELAFIKAEKLRHA